MAEFGNKLMAKDYNSKKKTQSPKRGDVKIGETYKNSLEK
jgi:hypothetical protein